MKFKMTLRKIDTEKNAEFKLKSEDVHKKRRNKIRNFNKSYNAPMCEEFRSYPYTLVLNSIIYPDDSKESQEIYDHFMSTVFLDENERKPGTEDFFIPYFDAIQEIIKEENLELIDLHSKTIYGEVIFEITGDRNLRDYFEINSSINYEAERLNAIGNLSGFKLNKEFLTDVIDKFQIRDLDYAFEEISKENISFWLHLEEIL